jgi:germination protein M
MELNLILKHELRKGFICLLTAVLIFTQGCGSSEKEVKTDSDKTYLYYLSDTENSLYPVSYEIDKDATTNKNVRTMLEKLGSTKKKDDYERLLPKDVRVRHYSLSEDGLLTIDFSDGYEDMEKTREVLVRAGIVRTMVQIEGVRNVRFTVDDSPAKDPSGNEIGVMNSETFVENAKQINAYKRVNIDLYFADSTGKELQIESRSIYYSTNKPLEWAIVERLIVGPKDSQNQPTLPSSTQILSITNSDGICYVNLSRSFITDALNIDERVPVYSIVDSICENCKETRRVQFSIEGNTDITFREHMNFKKPYTADVSLVKKRTESQ